VEVDADDDDDDDAATFGCLTNTPPVRGEAAATVDVVGGNELNLGVAIVVVIVEDVGGKVDPGDNDSTEEVNGDDTDELVSTAEDDEETVESLEPDTPPRSVLVLEFAGDANGDTISFDAVTSDIYCQSTTTNDKIIPWQQIARRCSSTLYSVNRVISLMT
jgi:hypothetical protein